LGQALARTLCLQSTMTTDNPALDRELPLVEHLREFRNRLVIVLVTLAVTTALCMPFADRALELLISPLDQKPIALSPTDTIVQYFRVALVGGVAFAMPMMLYQIVAFLLPALTRRERRYLFFFLPFATLLFAGGVLFAALIALPVSVSWLQDFGTNFAENQYNLPYYVEFVTTMLLGLGLGFELPLVIYFLAKLGIVTYPFLVKNSRWAFLITAIIAAVLTPTPDPLTMLVVLVPLFMLYLLGVLLARFA
jgi:sec-independent protein translocase protein TatC